MSYVFITRKPPFDKAISWNWLRPSFHSSFTFFNVIRCRYSCQACLFISWLYLAEVFTECVGGASFRLYFWRRGINMIYWPRLALYVCTHRLLLQLPKDWDFTFNERKNDVNGFRVNLASIEIKRLKIWMRKVYSTIRLNRIMRIWFSLLRGLRNLLEKPFWSLNTVL